MRLAVVFLLAALSCACGSSGDATGGGGSDSGRSDGGGTDDPDAEGAHATAIALSAGQDHVCVLRADGEVDCWGNGIFGKRGLTTDVERFPIKVVGLDGHPATAMAAGEGTQCVLVSDGVRCWGDGSYGQLGNGVTTYGDNPTLIGALGSSIAMIAGGTEHFCAIVAGAVQCWGNDYWAQIGDGATVTTRLVPTKVAGLPAAITIVAPGGMHTCAATTDQVWCWGENAWSQMGDGSAGGDPSTNITKVPVRVSGLGAGITDVSAGYRYTCAVVAGAAWCWGANEKGQLGDGSSTDRNVPVKVAGLGSVTSIRAGYDHTCAIADGGAWCWGNNASGMLGDGTSTDRSAPVKVVGLGSGVTSIAVGGSTSCAIASGRTWCWGTGGSALGSITKEGSIVSTPSRVYGF